MKVLKGMLYTTVAITAFVTIVGASGDADLGRRLSFGLIAGGFFSVYLLPTFIAFNRNHSNAAGIMIFNIFLGWTFVSWIVCLILSLANAAPVVVHHVHTGHVEHYPNPNGGPRARTVNYTEHQS
jgi:hypothetical protein